MPETNYESIPATIKEGDKPIEGVEFRVVKGTKLDMPEEIQRLFLEKARLLYADKARIEKMTEEQKEQKEQLLKFVRTIGGLRGVRSQNDDLSVLAVFAESEEYDEELLEKSLGIIFDNIVSKELVIKLIIPVKLTSAEEIRKILKETLAKLVPADQVDRVMEDEMVFRIDDEKLKELEANKKVTLLPGTREVTPSWKLNIERLRTPKTVRKKDAKKKDQAPTPK